MNEWGPQNKIHYLITDNVSNMVTCAKLLRIRTIVFFAHSLNLVAK